MIVRSGSTPVSSWAPPALTRKPVMTSSKTSSAPCSVASPRNSSRNPHAGRTRPMLAGYGSASTAASSCSAKAARTAASSFHGTITVPRGGRLRHAGRRRDALGREARARLREQAVDVPVVGPGELQQRLPARHRAGEPDRAHRRLGARRRHPQHVDATACAARPARRARPRPPSARRSSCRGRPRRAPPRRSPGGRDRGSAGPRSRRSRRRCCRRRRRSPRPRRAR